MPAVVCVAMSVHAGVAKADDLPAETGRVPVAAPESVGDRLATLEPRFPAPLLEAFAAPAEEPLPIRLLGVDLVQQHALLERETPRVVSGPPLEIVAYWSPNTDLGTGLSLAVRFSSRDGKITRSHDFSVGPGKGERPWCVGVVYKQSYAIDTVPLGMAFSGLIYVTLNFPSPNTAGVALTPLQSIEADLAPTVGKAKVAASRYPEFFGKDARSLSTSFRLGLRASVEIPIPAAWQQGVTAIGVVSAFSFGSVKQGQPLCEVVVVSADGHPTTLLLESGVTTARADYDFNGPEHENHQRIAPIESTEADYLNVAGAPFKKHKYPGILPLPRPLDRASSITFRAAGSVILDVYDVLLLYGPCPEDTAASVSRGAQ
ncbi:MAG TPA: hypothetical protein PLO37_04100 [Candidatus Hydrogenedentes bacterium]|nr:hypothetical protein [Candidatus Hydrogenedentota bacterium]